MSCVSLRWYSLQMMIWSLRTMMILLLSSMFQQKKEIKLKTILDLVSLKINIYLYFWNYYTWANLFPFIFCFPFTGQKAISLSKIFNAMKKRERSFKTNLWEAVNLLMVCLVPTVWTHEFADFNLFIHFIYAISHMSSMTYFMS